jgi:hypothetical protein
MDDEDATNYHKQWRAVGRKQKLENETYTCGQDKWYKVGEIGGRVARVLATVARV